MTILRYYLKLYHSASLKIYSRVKTYENKFDPAIEQYFVKRRLRRNKSDVNAISGLVVVFNYVPTPRKINTIVFTASFYRNHRSFTPAAFMLYETEIALTLFILNFLH